MFIFLNILFFFSRELLFCPKYLKMCHIKSNKHKLCYKCTCSVLMVHVKLQKRTSVLRILCYSLDVKEHFSFKPQEESAPRGLKDSSCTSSEAICTNDLTEIFCGL